MRTPITVCLILLGVQAAAEGGHSSEEFYRCIDGADSSINSCHDTAYTAAEEADALAAQQASQAGRDSLNQASDREAAVTQKISSILARAKAACEAQAKECVSKCTGDLASMGQGCAKDIGKYVEQLSQGRKENVSGHAGSVSADKASSSAGSLAPGAGSTARGSSPTGTSDAADSSPSSSLNNNPNGRKLSDILQRPDSGDSNHSTGARGKRTGQASGDADPSSDGAAGSAAGGSQVWGTSSIRPQDEAPEQEPEDNHGRQRSLMRKMLQGSELDSAILNYCKTTGAGDAECDSIVSSNFCAQAGRGQCPSCQNRAPKDFSPAEMGKVCVAACAGDPRHGPELADRCRTVLGAAEGEHAPERAPANTAEISAASGPSLFVIVSRTIERRCFERKLLCGR